jgi:hypothetical protein
MYDFVAWVKCTILAYLVLVRAPEGEMRGRGTGDEQAIGGYLAPLGLKNLHMGQTLVATWTEP